MKKQYLALVLLGSFSLLTACSSSSDTSSTTDTTTTTTDTTGTTTTTTDTTGTTTTTTDTTGTTTTTTDTTGTTTTTTDTTGTTTTTTDTTGTTTTTAGDTVTTATDSTGTSVATGSGIVTIPRISASDAQVVSDSKGVIHALYSVTSGPSTIEYGECAANCGDATSWNIVVLYSNPSFLSFRAEMVVDKTDTVHVVYDNVPDGSTSSAYDYPVYMTCSNSCLSAQSWTSTALINFQGLWSVYRSSPLVVTQSGGLYMIRGTGGSGQYLLSCAGGCTDANAWMGYPFGYEFSRASMVAVGDTLHLVSDNKQGQLVYGTCTSNCGDLANWVGPVQVAYHDGLKQIELTANENGRLVLFYNQGDSGWFPAEVTAYNSHHLLWTCDANCDQSQSWVAQMDFGASGSTDGFDVVARGDAIGVVMANSTLELWRCDADCANAQSWTTSVLDSNDILNQTFDAKSFIGCTDEFGNLITPWQAFWYAYTPQIALLPSGSAAVLHNPYVLRACTPLNSVTRLGSIGRMIYLQ